MIMCLYGLHIIVFKNYLTLITVVAIVQNNKNSYVLHTNSIKKVNILGIVVIFKVS